MNASERERFGIEPADGALRELLQRHAGDPVGFIIDARDTLKSSFANYMQMERLTSLATVKGVKGARQSPADFYNGAAIAYTLMCKIGGDAHMQDELYRALGTLESYVRQREGFDNGSIQKLSAMAELFDTDPHLTVLDGKEEVVLADIVSAMTEDDDNPERLLDMTRGYNMVRMAIPWAHARRRADIDAIFAREVRPAFLQSKIFNAVRPDPLDETNNTVEPALQNELAAFWEAFGDDLPNIRPLDGLEVCVNDVEALRQLFEEEIAKVPETDLDNPAKSREVFAYIAQSMGDQLEYLSQLQDKDELTIFGDMTVLIYSDRYELMSVLSMNGTSTIRGVLADVDVKYVPTQKYVDDNAYKEPKNQSPMDSDDDVRPGPGLLLERAIIADARGDTIHLEKNEFMLVPIHYRDIQVYRDPAAQQEVA